MADTLIHKLEKDQEISSEDSEIYSDNSIVDNFMNEE